MAAAKPPTASGISRLLADAGHDRAKPGTSGFRVTRSFRDHRIVLVDYLVADRMPEADAQDRMSAMARTLRDAGWHVEAGTYELTVTASTPEEA